MKEYLPQIVHEMTVPVLSIYEALINPQLPPFPALVVSNDATWHVCHIHFCISFFAIG